jgi:twinkle protein
MDRPLSNQVIDYIQCPQCRDAGRDNSKNNLAIYADGHGYCYAGHGFYPKVYLKELLKDTSFLSSSVRKRSNGTTKGITNTPMDIQENNQEKSLPEYPDLDYREWRNVTAETMRFFDVKSNDELIIFPWGPEARLCRSKAEKRFWWEGKARESQGLFGMERFPSGDRFVITIFEGALDAMMGWQLLGGKYPCVAVKSASTALQDCTREFEWLNGYEKIKLALDWDKPGQDAAQQVARLFDVNKVYWMRP